MKKTIKTKDVFEAYSVLNTAKYNKLEDADKIKLWKIARSLKPVATKYEEDNKDAAEKMKQGFDGFDDKSQKLMSYQQKKRNGETDLPMTEKEYLDFLNGDWAKFNKLVFDAVKEFGEKEVEIDFEPLSEEALTKLISSNDWTINNVMAIGDIII